MGNSHNQMCHEIIQHLKCNVCGEKFNSVRRPYLMACQHSICERCLQFVQSRHVQLKEVNCLVCMAKNPRPVFNKPLARITTTMKERGKLNSIVKRK